MRVNGIIVGVLEKERNREGVMVLLNEVWHSLVIDVGCLNLESYGSSSSFQVLKFVWGRCIVPVSGMLEKWRGSEMTWTW